MGDEPFSLLRQAWLPVRRGSGKVECIRPAELNDKIDIDPVVAFAWPRADFDAASRELLIGLLATACWCKTDEDEWERWWHDPPDPAELDRHFTPIEAAFLLDGSGPRFMQDQDELTGDAVPVAGLLIDSPGANAIKRNTDIFVKRGRAAQLGRPGAAMALFTLMIFAPSGGAGHRTSLRGGGPTTTLLLPTLDSSGAPRSLWHQLWANVSWNPRWPDPLATLEGVFPWLAPTRVSDKGRKTTPDDVHPAQCYWGMPRRIRLNFAPNEDGKPCALTGEVDSVVVPDYRTRPHGNDYKGWSQGHPLSPYYRQKPTNLEWLPVHPQPGRLGYQDWVGLVVGDSDDTERSLRLPAEAVSVAKTRLRRQQVHGARLLASGYDMDNMKARGFVESYMPVRFVAPAMRESYDAAAREFVFGAREAERILSYAVRAALFGNGNAAADAGDRRLVRDRFWEDTEQPFHDAVAQLASDLEAAATDEALERAVLNEAPRHWYVILKQAVLRLFDARVPFDALGGPKAERIVKARRDLRNALAGYGRSGTAFFNALRLPLPEPTKPKSKVPQ
ncbi:type I-E CRISPR-associated protein Cse1/CasA [Marinivivus vitaminiproducens]|uniref:type I-E CRISPR-associated protein Cse1/CasA n=1 Tax=Marinivivus vitaminiproducens TaxID=3035935 RepID=UPI00279FD2EA|nr:type I-E CRISPR-associated protein Cse1/CasA [Geminicoccaceae bacterium SCSIO 64248]